MIKTILIRGRKVRCRALNDEEKPRKGDISYRAEASSCGGVGESWHGRSADEYNDCISVAYRPIKLSNPRKARQGSNDLKMYAYTTPGTMGGISPNCFSWLVEDSDKRRSHGTKIILVLISPRTLKGHGKKGRVTGFRIAKGKERNENARTQN